MNNFDHSCSAQSRGGISFGCKVGLGSLALASLMAIALRRPRRKPAQPPARLPASGAFPAKAKNVIFLFMAGGPSQLELFDNKPKLQEMDGQVIPESYVKNKRFAFIKQDAKLLGSRRKFAPCGQSGAEISELLPHLKTVVDDICLVKSMHTDVFNHGPAKLFVNTGSPQFMGRPSMGAWVTYGIGSESQDLPGFVVLQSGPRGRAVDRRCGPAVLADDLSGRSVPIRLRADSRPGQPPGIDANRQKQFVDAVNDLNRLRLDDTQDPEITTRIAAYEMAYRMQSSAPELMSLAGETAETIGAYGAEPGKPSFANNCLLARRLVERGVRFVQLYHTDWDHHGNAGTELANRLTSAAAKSINPPRPSSKTSRAAACSTAHWSSGGRIRPTPQGEPRDMLGRDHHIEGYTMWLAGGGIKAGQTIGKTDELGYYAVEDKVHVHDLQATILHLLGIDHLKLTYRFQGRDYRLTDVAGNIVQKMLA